MNNNFVEFERLFLPDESNRYSDQLYQDYLVGLHYRLVEAKHLPSFLSMKKAVKMQWNLANKAMA